jgi:SAM-dependent methyltransferase
MVRYTNCPLCHASNLDDYIQVSDHFLSGEKFMLIKCRECGLVFTQDHPDEKDAGRYYESENYVSHNDKAGGIAAAVYRIAREFMLKRKYRMIGKEAGLKKGKLLDIGSGTGHFLAMMKKKGWTVTGIELNEKAREYSKENFGFDVMPGIYDSVRERGPFDVITLWHVLEHFHDPFSYMNEISKLLKKEGILVIALPNSQSSDALYYSEFWAAWDVPRHIWHFTPDVFKQFAEKYGFALKSVKPLPLDVFYISILSERYRKSKIPFIKGLFRGAWLILTGSLTKHKSSSLIYILVKQ